MIKLDLDKLISKDFVNRIRFQMSQKIHDASNKLRIVNDFKVIVLSTINPVGLNRLVPASFVYLYTMPKGHDLIISAMDDEGGSFDPLETVNSR